MSRRHSINIFLFLLALLVIAGASQVGIRQVPLRAIWDSGVDASGHRLFWNLRLPRVLVTFFVGVGLSLAGMCFQALFRNPLATPFTLGVSGGAALGATLCLRFGLASFTLLGISAPGYFAFGGAGISILLVYGLSRQRSTGTVDSTMLLAGVAASYLFSSLIMLMQYVSDFAGSFQISRLLMGGTSGASWPVVGGLAFCTAIISALAFCYRDDLNLLTVGEEFASSRGVEVKQVRMLLFFGVSLTVGWIVSICGPIGFVGMICPHLCRLVVGANHRRLMPASLFFGGIFLTICDTIARRAMAPAEIPVGVITSLLGGPFFLWLLLRRRGK